MKRTGLAITDSSNIIASPLETVDTQNLMNRLVELVEKEKISTIVLGEPKNLDSSDTHITQNVRLLKEALEKKFETVKIVSVDERFTSKMASLVISQSGLKKKDREQKGLIDEVSATIILQDYLQARMK